MNTFPKTEHLFGEKVIENLFKNGQSFITYPYRVVFLDVSHSVEELPLRVMMSVSKKKFKKAVTRNRIKRLMREVYRLNKTELVNFASDEKIKIHVAFQYVADEILSFDEMNNKMIKLTDKLKRNLIENLKKTDENG